MKDETGAVAIQEFVGFKPKMNSFLVDDNSKHKKARQFLFTIKMWLQQ